ncbi:MAG: putative ABC-type molybdate transport system, periplasmic component ModA [Burkholderiaceae bacterium]|nr:putative ABC-type molybdate transport system, periplasmic component ModA [Burkholderiaceae bacterium]
MNRKLLKRCGATWAAAVLLCPLAVNAQDAPLLMAAGSLREAMNEMVRVYQAQGGGRFAVQYGPSGHLRQAIESGQRADVFASADVKHTDALASSGRFGASTVFTHNDLCVIARPQLALDETNLLGKLTQPAVRVATSTPVSDPMGDYTWQFFHQADRAQPGAFGVLDRKARKLSGATAPKPGEKLPYVTAFEHDQADAYVMYCTNAVTTRKSLPELHIVRIPAALNVRSAYGIAAHPASSEGARFVRFVLGEQGQQILRRYGFN